MIARDNLRHDYLWCLLCMSGLLNKQYYAFNNKYWHREMLFMLLLFGWLICLLMFHFTYISTVFWNEKALEPQPFIKILQRWQHDCLWSMTMITKSILFDDALVVYCKLHLPHPGYASWCLSISSDFTYTSMSVHINYLMQKHTSHRKPKRIF